MFRPIEAAADRVLPGVTERRAATVAAGGVLVILAVANVMSNVIIPDWAYVPWNLLVAGLCLLVGRRLLTSDQLGLAENRRGLRWGAVLALGMVVILLVGLALPLTRGLFTDDRVGDSVAMLLYHPFLRIPLGTVVLEEIAFRSVLPGLLALRWGVFRASLAASAAFGLWHILPATKLVTRNASAASTFGDSTVGQVAAVALAVFGATLAGLWFSWLRYRSRSVVTTMVAHTSSNSLGYLFAWFVR